MKPTREPLVVSTTKLHPSGAWECSTLVNGHRFAMTYHGYTKQGAIGHFRRRCRIGITP